MIRILKYSFFDLMRSKWTYFYCLFYALITFALFWLSSDISKVIITLMNIVLILVPLIATVFGIMYNYNSREFTELLLAQPIRRTDIFIGQYFGVALSLALSVLIGIGIPFMIYGVFMSSEIWNYVTLLFTAVMLSMIFSAVAYLIALNNENRIKGFGKAILFWLGMAVLYDGLLLVLLVAFNDYPLEKIALGLSLANPIDLSRILLLIKLDISALMGFTGAVFKQYLGSLIGISTASAVLILWLILPIWRIKSVSMKKDF